MDNKIFKITFINQFNCEEICCLCGNWTPRKGELINFMHQSYEVLEISYTIQNGTIPVIVLVTPFEKGK